MKELKLIECPRDAMQGFEHPIDTGRKVAYINGLLKAGFYALDCGSFVSARAVPMLADTAEVLSLIDYKDRTSRLLTIVANERGAEEACRFPQVDILGFPFSISETFQLRNTRQSIAKASLTLQNIQRIAQSCGKEVLVYLSMGFGNPYGDEWSPEIALEYSKQLAGMGITLINLSDTIGVAGPDSISRMFTDSLNALPEVEFGAHFHTRPDNYLENLAAAYDSGCRKFDSAIRGFGGCPFASDKLTGNLPTEDLIGFLDSRGVALSINRQAFATALQLAEATFV